MEQGYSREELDLMRDVEILMLMNDYEKFVERKYNEECKKLI